MSFRLAACLCLSGLVACSHNSTETAKDPTHVGQPTDSGMQPASLENTQTPPPADAEARGPWVADAERTRSDVAPSQRAAPPANPSTESADPPTPSADPPPPDNAAARSSRDPD